MEKAFDGKAAEVLSSLGLPTSVSSDIPDSEYFRISEAVQDFVIDLATADPDNPPDETARACYEILDYLAELG